MNSRQLQKLGVPEECVQTAIAAIQNITKSGGVRGKQVKQLIRDVIDRPQDFTEDEQLGQFAKDVLDERSFVRPEPIDYQTWGTDIDDAAHAQMKQACGVPMAAGAALMPDAHVGYGLPIGGVLALEGAVIPYAVGVDIACRMKLSILDMPASTIESKFNLYRGSLGGWHPFRRWRPSTRPPRITPVMDAGLVGYPDHSGEEGYGLETARHVGVGESLRRVRRADLDVPDEELGLEAGQYVALLSHSGSRGTGAAVCAIYSGIARAQLPKRYEDLCRSGVACPRHSGGPGILGCDEPDGRLRRRESRRDPQPVAKLLGAKIIAGVENHHNFAWKEIHGGGS